MEPHNPIGGRDFSRDEEFRLTGGFNP